MLPLAGCSIGTQDAAPAGRETSQRAVYRIEDLAGDGNRVTTKVVEIASPFRARSEVLEGEPPGGTSLGGVAFDATRQYLLRADGSAAVVQVVAPRFAGPDTHLDVALAVARRHGLATVMGPDTVEGRPCTQWLSREPLDSGPILPAAGGDRTVSCVADDGVLVHDSWSLKGDVVRRRTLVELGAGQGLTGAALLGGASPTPAPSAPPLEQVQDVAVAKLVTALGIPVPAAPLGLPADRSVALIQAVPGQAPAVEGGVLSWTDGRRLVVLRVERGLTAPLRLGTAGVPGRAGLRPVRIEAVPEGLRIRFGGPAGLVAEALANVPEDELLAWVAGLSLG